jgi:hypothetical protein
MAKANKKPRASRRKSLEIAGPTPEQMEGGCFVLEDVTDKRDGGGTINLGKAYRRKPMIQTLAEQGLFSDAEYKALKHYRHHADLADRSLVRDSLGKQAGGSGGSGNGPTIEMLNAVRITTDCEAAAGSLKDILRAVAVDDMSLSQWAIKRSGGIDDCATKNGQTVCRIKPRQKALAIAKLEIKMVAKRVESELSA